MSGTGHEFTQRECDETYTYIKILLFPSPENLNRTTNKFAQDQEGISKFHSSKGGDQTKTQDYSFDAPISFTLKTFTNYINFLDSANQTLFRVTIKYSL